MLRSRTVAAFVILTALVTGGLYCHSTQDAGVVKHEVPASPRAQDDPFLHNGWRFVDEVLVKMGYGDNQAYSSQVWALKGCHRHAFFVMPDGDTIPEFVFVRDDITGEAETMTVDDLNTTLHRNISFKGKLLGLTLPLAGEENPYYWIGILPDEPVTTDVYIRFDSHACGLAVDQIIYRTHADTKVVPVNIPLLKWNDTPKGKGGGSQQDASPVTP